MDYLAKVVGFFVGEIALWGRIVRRGHHNTLEAWLYFWSALGSTVMAIILMVISAKIIIHLDAKTRAMRAIGDTSKDAGPFYGWAYLVSVIVICIVWVGAIRLFRRLMLVWEEDR